MENQDLDLKKCWNCQEFLPLDKFTLSQQKKKSGAECQSCCKKRNKARFDANKQVYKDNAKKWQRENPERWKEVNAAKQRRYYHKNLEKMREYQRKRYWSAKNSTSF